MKSRKIISIFSMLLLSLVAIVACVKDTDYELPDYDKGQLTPFNGEIVSFTKANSSATAEVTDYAKDEAIEGYIVSSDEGGNFYKKLYIQNEEKTAGVAVSIDKTALYTEFPVGSKVQLRLKGLSTQINNGGLEIGYKTYTSSSGRVSVGSIPPAVYSSHLFVLKDQNKTVEELAKADASIETLKVNSNVNQLITLKNVSFQTAAIGKTYHLKANDAQQGTNYNLIDKQGQKIAFRTSRYANFIDEKVPAGILDVTGVLTKYGSSYQFMVSSTSDIKVIGEGNNEEETEQITISQFPFDESFSSGMPKGWKTIATKGDRLWEIKTFNKVNYVQMSAFKQNAVIDVTTWLITPKFNITTEDLALKIKLADAHQNGNPLKIYYSSDYNGSNDVNGATWKELGKSAIDALINNSGKYDNNYEESAAIPLPKGEIYIAFVYESGGKISTTVQLQNVHIGQNQGETPDNPDTDATLKTVKEIRELLASETFVFEENVKIKVVITSDKDAKNVAGANAFAQDNTAGIALRFASAHSYALGTELELNLKGTKLKKYNGLLQIEGLKVSNVINQKADAGVPTPKTITIAEALTGNYESQLVRIENAQFTDVLKIYSGTQTITTDCTNHLAVYTRKEASFAGKDVSDKKGTITGVMGVHSSSIQLIMRNINDVKFENDYTKCEGDTPDNPDTEATLKTVKEIRELLKAETFVFEENVKIKVVITSDKDAKNVAGANAFAQDDTAGITLRFASAHSYALGTELELNLKGATLRKFKGLLQIDGLKASNVINKKADAGVPTPKTITIAEALTGNYESQLVRIENAQFTDVLKIYSGTQTITTDCTNHLVVYTRKEASFAGKDVSDKKGTITGVMAVHNSTIQLIMRNVTDVKFENDYTKCEGDNPDTEATLKTVKEIRELLKAETFVFEENVKIKVVITSDKDAKNVAGTNAFAQDNTAGIALRFASAHSYALGTELELNLKGATLRKFKGLLQIDGLKASNVINKKADAGVPTPKTITIADALTGNYESQLVRIENAQFTATSTTYNGAKEITTDCTNVLTIFSRKEATFANENVNDKKGTITGVMAVHNSTIQLIMRNVTDVNFTETRQDCGGSGDPSTPTYVEKTVSEIRAIHTSVDVDITEDFKIKVVVTSDKGAKNVGVSNAFAQDNTAGIALRFASEHHHALGTELELNLKGTKLKKYNGLLQIEGLKVGNIINVNTSAVAPTPKTITIADALTGNYESQLVRIENAQFTATSTTYNGVKEITTDCTNALTIFTRNQASFANENVSDKKGTITGIMAVHNSTIQLIMRNVTDVNFTETRQDCGGSGDPSTPTYVEKTVSEIRAMHTSANVDITEDFKIKVIVTSDKDAGNVGGTNAFAQDNTAGIALRFASEHDHALGTELELNLKGTKLKKYNGLLQIEGLKVGNIINVNTSAVAPTPKTITITDALTGNYESQLVRIENAQFKVTSTTYKGTQVITTNCDNALKVYTRNKAAFANETVSDKKGTITGVMAVYSSDIQLIIRNLGDVNFTEAYQVCTVTPPANKFDFENVTTNSTSYGSTATLTVNNAKLEYKARTNLGDYAISGKGLMLHNSSASPYIKITFSNGVKKLKFSYKGALTGGTNRKFVVLNGDENSTTAFGPEDDFSKDAGGTKEIDVNLSGNVVITIKSTLGQIVFDDIEWEE
ncbi:DUF5689 domain-containing protein [Capnocytophaga canis]|uniref:DUF5689 domain-containing protein n=4 Tax=Capnocytophaga canis TaxID=1848903 RepID=UPI0037CD3606